jgi:ribosomal-protein-alanine N-acetyltransferase
MSELRIRLAREGDAPLLAGMSRDTIEKNLPWRYREPEMLRFMRSPRYNVIVAEVPGIEDNRVITGFAVMGYSENDAYLALLATDPMRRRQGIARQMLDWLLKTAETAGAEAVSVELREDNSAAQRLYEQRGFMPAGTRTGGYYGVVNQNRMRLQLRPPAGA